MVSPPRRDSCYGIVDESAQGSGGITTPAVPPPLPPSLPQKATRSTPWATGRPRASGRTSWCPPSRSANCRAGRGPASKRRSAERTLSEPPRPGGKYYTGKFPKRRITDNPCCTPHARHTRERVPPRAARRRPLVLVWVALFQPAVRGPGRSFGRTPEPRLAPPPLEAGLRWPVARGGPPGRLSVSLWGGQRRIPSAG